MSIYKVTAPGHGLAIGDLLFGGEYFHASINLEQMRFKAYDEHGANKHFVFLPLNWLLANVEISILEDKDGPAERAFQDRLRGQRRQASGNRPPPLLAAHSPTGRLPAEPVLSEADKRCSHLGDLYTSNKPEFTRTVNEWLGTLPRITGRQIILLSDRMSGDSRLAGLYAAYRRYPVLYIVTRSKLGKRDLGIEYLKDLHVHILGFAVEDAHVTYSAFNLQLGCQVRKGAKLTEEIGYLMNLQPNPHNQQAPNGPAFRGTAQALVFVPEAPRSLKPLLQETRPILVVWTKSKAVPTLLKGRPEHLLGKTGTLQVCDLGRQLNFAIALAGDIEPTPALKSLIDYDLRYTSGGLAGLSMKQQYGVLQHINVYVPLVHLAMRSGNIEPLPLLGMRTVYMEEFGNNQGERMQKLESATKGFYDRHVFSIPPTIKGRLREMVTYFFDWNFRQAVKETPVETEMLRLLNLLVTKTFGYTGDFASLDDMLKNAFIKADLWGFFNGLSESDDGFARLKDWVKRDEFPKGFSELDISTLKAKLQQLRVEAAVLLGVSRMRALVAGIQQ